MGADGELCRQPAREEERAPGGDGRELSFVEPVVGTVVGVSVAVADIAIRRRAGGQDRVIGAGGRVWAPCRRIEVLQRSPRLALDIAVARVLEAEVDGRKVGRRGEDAR